MEIRALIPHQRSLIGGTWEITARAWRALISLEVAHPSHAADRIFLPPHLRWLENPPRTRSEPPNQHTHTLRWVCVSVYEWDVCVCCHAVRLFEFSVLLQWWNGVTTSRPPAGDLNSKHDTIFVSQLAVVFKREETAHGYFSEHFSSSMHKWVFLVAELCMWRRGEIILSGCVILGMKERQRYESLVFLILLGQQCISVSKWNETCL